MISDKPATDRFGSAPAEGRRAEWRRLALFIAIGAGLFLLAVVGAAFVPFSWPDPIRRSAHPMFFVPLVLVLTIRMLRKDASELPREFFFDPWPIRRVSIPWLLLGSALACVVTLMFVVAFGLRWVPNPHWSGLNLVLMVWAILLIAAAEEFAFRGYAFWKLTRLLGFWQAQTIVAALFALSHMTLGGYTSWLPALIGTVTGSILYGAAFARTRTIAASLALHTGWNIVQHLLLSPLNPSATPLVPMFRKGGSAWEYGTMLAIIGVVMAATTFGILKADIRRNIAITETRS